MKKMISHIPVHIIYILIVCLFSGCGFSGSFDYEGKSLVDKAASLHTSLESAHIEVYDDGNGQTAQEITYRFVGDIMQYMYIGRDSVTGETYYEFNNGTELDKMTVPPDTSWSFASKGSEEYYSYSRSSRHYFSDGASLLNDYEAAVSSSKLDETSDGGKSLELWYDAEKLAGSYGADYRELHQIFYFDKDGRCGSFEYTYIGGDGKNYSYTITISPCDPGKPIERAEPEL